MVEQELTQYQSLVKMLEQPVKALEVKLGIASKAGERESTANAY
jgi:hypothetical protein